MAEEEFDVVVVGGGPAGIVAAITAASEGMNVCLFDVKDVADIGSKICGDAVDKKAPALLEERLGISPPHGDAISDQIRHMVLATSTSGGTELRIRAPGYVVDRLKYGQQLLKEAVSRGVEIRGSTRVMSALIEDGYCVGVAWRDKTSGTDGTTRSKIVIDASGVVAAVRSRLPLDFEPSLDKNVDKRFLVSCYREIIELRSDGENHPWAEEIVLVYEDDVPYPGYIWFFSKGAYRLNVGTGWIKKDASSRMPLKPTFHSAFKKHFSPSDYKVLHAGGGIAPVRPPLDNSVANGFMAVGDAACNVDPTTAEGHGPALRAGYYAGMTACKAITGSDVSRDNLWSYNCEIMSDFGVLHGMSFALADFMESIGSKGLKWVFDSGIATQADIVAVYDDPEKGFGTRQILGKIWKGMPHFGRLWKLRSLSKRMLAARDIYSQYPRSFGGLSEWQGKRDRVYPSLSTE